MAVLTAFIYLCQVRFCGILFLPCGRAIDFTLSAVRLWSRDFCISLFGKLVWCLWLLLNSVFCLPLLGLCSDLGNQLLDLFPWKPLARR